MSDLDCLGKEFAGSVRQSVSGVSPPPFATLAAKTNPRQRPPGRGLWMAVVSAAAVLAVFGPLVFWGGGTTPGSNPSTTPGSTTSPSTTRPPVTPVWQSIRIGQEEFVVGYVSTETGLRAVVQDNYGHVRLIDLSEQGHRIGPGTLVTVFSNVVTVVTDRGVVESELVDTGGGYIAAATRFGDKIVGVGQVPPSFAEFGPAVWVKQDGTWQSAAMPADTGIFDLTGVAAGPGGLVTISRMNEHSAPVLLWSNDAATWEVVSLPLAEPGSVPFLSGVVWVDGRYLVIGYGMGRGGLTMWTSVDGRDWVLEPPLDGLFGDGTRFVWPITLTGTGVGMAGDATFRAHPAFCYEDVSTCMLTTPAIWLLDTNGWMRLPPPPGVDHDLRFVGTDGNVVAVSQGSTGATIWVTTTPARQLALPPVESVVPDLGLPFAEHGGNLDLGVDYAYPFGVSCNGWSHLGRFNGTYWIGSQRPEHGADLSFIIRDDMIPQFSIVFGKLVLVAPDHIVYSDMNGVPVADFHPAPAGYQPPGCW